MEQHIIIAALIENHTIEPIVTARRYNDAETTKSIEAYQSAWDAGESFINDGMFGPVKRVDDSDVEISACVEQLYSILLGIIANGWVANLSRVEAVTICNALSDASVRICGDVDLNSYEIAFRWNKIHSSEQQIVVPAPQF